MAGFSDQLAKFAAKTKLSADVAVRKVALQVAGSLIERSPVDSGRFKNNWIAGVNVPNTATSVEADKSGSAALGRISQAIAAVPAGGVIYICNSLPYARRLEYGWSKQAANGMVRITALEYQQFLRKALAS
jgi:hypothetical protein